MEKVSRIALGRIKIESRSPAFMKIIPAGTLVVTRRMVSDGSGGWLSGRLRWVIETSYQGVLPFDMDTLEVSSGSYSGECHVVSQNPSGILLEGTGVLKGFE